MNVHDVLEKLREVIVSDFELKSWCQSEYSKDHTVFLGTNPNVPPESYSYPAVVIDSVYERSQAVTRASLKVLIGLLLKDDRKTDSFGSVTYIGFLNCEKFRDEVQKSIMRGQRILKAKIEFSDGGTFTNSVFPIWSGKMALYIEYAIPGNRIQDAI